MKRFLIALGIVGLAGCASPVAVPQNMFQVDAATETAMQPVLKKYPGSILSFDCQATTLTDDQRALLTSDITYLTAHPTAQVLLTAYAKYQGSVNYTLAQNQLRLQAVSDDLKLKGVAATQIQMINYGPSDGNYQSQNCRVVLTYEEN